MYFERLKAFFSDTPEQKEAGRKRRMANHPHNTGCDMTGDIEVVKKGRMFPLGGGSIAGEVFMYIGRITACTSCGREEKTGTLKGE